MTSEEYEPEKKKKIKSEIIRILKKCRSVTFTQLAKIEGFKRNREIGLLEYNIIFWAGLSKEAVVAVNEFRQENFFRPEAGDVFTYAKESEILDYPLAEKHQKYEEPHWAPILLVLND